MYLLCLPFFPLLYVLGIRAAFQFKGCLDPSLSQKIAIRCMIIDCLVKVLCYPLCDDLESYIALTMWLSLFFMGYCLVCIYWNLDKQSNRDSKKYPNNVNYTLCGFKYLGISIFFILFNVLLLTYGWHYDEVEDASVAIIVSTIILGIYTYIYFVEMLRLDRLKLPSLRSIEGLSSQRKPIVLLRSFQIDDAPAWNNKTIDEVLCESINMELYPIISLANPDEILPTGGSIKIQAKDDYWKEVVEEVLSNCKAVLLVEGRSDGLHWEISKLKEYLNPNQLYVYIPPKRYRILAWCVNNENGAGIYKNISALFARLVDSKAVKRNLKEVWNGFSTLLNHMELSIPKSFPGNNTLITFNDSWKAEGVMKFKKFSEMWNSITTKTGEKESDYNYRILADRIMAYEVNGFLSTEKAELYKSQLKKILKVSNVVALCLITAIVFVWMLF